MLTAKITFQITAPIEDVTEKQFKEWILQELGAGPNNVKNPMFNEDLRGKTSKIQIQIKR